MQCPICQIEMRTERGPLGPVDVCRNPRCRNFEKTMPRK